MNMIKPRPMPPKPQKSAKRGFRPNRIHVKPKQARRDGWLRDISNPLPERAQEKPTQ